MPHFLSYLVPLLRPLLLKAVKTNFASCLCLYICGACLKWSVWSCFLLIACCDKELNLVFQLSRGLFGQSSWVVRESSRSGLKSLWFILLLRRNLKYWILWVFIWGDRIGANDKLLGLQPYYYKWFRGELLVLEK